jgi:hypothetical protein
MSLGRIKMLMKLPKCCGHPMKIKMDIGLFLEVQCDSCKDIVYVKKSEMPRPQMLDD